MTAARVTYSRAVRAIEAHSSRHGDRGRMEVIAVTGVAIVFVLA
jgi:hypothetical protein